MKTKTCCSKSLRLKILLVVATSWFPFSASAQFINWTNPSAGDWFATDNWSNNQLPSFARSGSINNGGTAQISAPGAEIAVLRLGVESGDTGTLEVSNGSLDVFNSITVGLSGHGTLNLTDGAVSSFSSVIGDSAGSTGSVIVSGGTWTNSEALIVGRFGTGTLNLAGGTVAADSLVLADEFASTGTLNIGTGGAAGILNTASVTGGSGEATLNFNHNEEDYYFTRDGTSAGAAINIVGSTTLNHLGTGTTTLSGINTQTGGTVVQSGRLILDGGSISHSNTNNALIVGLSGGDDGTFEIRDGAVFSFLSAIGDSAGSTGTVIVSGGTWTNSEELMVGRFGTGTLNLAGGTVAADSLALAGGSGSTGTLNIGTGGAAGILNTASVTGGSGEAILNFNHNEADYYFTRDGTSAGAAINIGGSATLNHLGTGTTTLSGINTQTGGTVVQSGRLILDGGSISHSNTNNALIVGLSGGDDGTFEILDGAVSSFLSVIGDSASSNGTVIVSGGTWTNTTNLRVGNEGTGTLEISGSGAVSSLFNILGSENGSIGTAIVSGGWWTSSSLLVVGNNGTGILELSGGGQISSTIGFIGNFANASGSADVSGGTWTNSEELIVGRFGTGTLNLAGGTVAADYLVLAGGSGSTGTLNIGTGEAAGILNTASVTGGSGEATLNFNHNEAAHFFTRDGTSGGDAINIEGSISLNHIGTGTTILSGTNTHTGGTVVSDGTLIVTGSHEGSIVITVAGLDPEDSAPMDGPGPGGPPVDGGGGLGGTFGGSGTVGQITLLAGGILSPGLSPGTLTAESLDWQGGSFLFDLGADATDSDFLSLNGALTGTSESLLFTFVDNGWAIGQTYDLIGFGSTSLLIEQFGFTNEGDGLDGLFAFNTEGDILQFTVIPEPATWTLIVGAVGWILALGHRRPRQRKC